MKSSQLWAKITADYEKLKAQKFVNIYDSQSPLDETDTKHWHLYVINAGDPRFPGGDAHVKKSAVSYVGCSKEPVLQRVSAKNDPLTAIKNKKTSPGVCRWILFLVVFLPTNWPFSSKNLKNYCAKGHSLSGKLARFSRIVNLFKFKYFIPVDRAEHVVKFMAAPDTQPAKQEPGPGRPRGRPKGSRGSGAAAMHLRRAGGHHDNGDSYSEDEDDDDDDDDEDDDDKGLRTLDPHKEVRFVDSMY
jgi:hypothetical protein